MITLGEKTAWKLGEKVEVILYLNTSIAGKPCDIIKPVIYP